MAPVSRPRSGKGKGKGRGSSRSVGSSKAARSGNPQVRAAAAELQDLRAERRRLGDSIGQLQEELHRPRRKHAVLQAEQGWLLDDFSVQRRAVLDAWYAGHAAALLAETHRLAAAADPAALEQATAELIADRLLVMREDEDRACEVTHWASDWLAIVAAGAAEHADPGSWLLLHGLAAICPSELAAIVQESIAARAPGAPTSPAWLPLTSQLTIDAAVRVFTDAYGLRSAVLATGRRPDGPARTYLLDVDLCPGYPAVVGSGWYAGEDAALVAWAAAVGPSADTSAGGPGPVLLAPVSGASLGAAAVEESSLAAVDVLAGLLPLEEDPNELVLGEGDAAERAVALLRDRRIIADLAAALSAAGADPSGAAQRVLDDVDRAPQWAAEQTPGFLAWCGARVTRQPPADLVEEMLTEWAAYIPQRRVWACSPHRVLSFAAQLQEEWADHGRVRSAWSLIEPWAEYCLRRRGLPEPLGDAVQEAARVVTRAPLRIATQVVDTWRTATDETSPLAL